MLNSSNFFLTGLIIGTSLSMATSSLIDVKQNDSKKYSNTYNISRLQNDDIKCDNCMNLTITNYQGDQKQGDSMSVELTRNLNKLNMIENLKLGEDKLITFSNAFITEITRLLYELDFQPEVFPNFLGNIQLEYEEDNGKYLEIEITPDMKMNIFKIDEDGTEHENEIYSDVDLEEINKEVNAFYE